jgi:hypothetical protein
MKIKLIRIVLSVAVLLGLTISAAAEGPGGCGPQGAVGEWGFTFTGTVLPGTSTPMLFAGVAKVVVKEGGQFTGSETSSTNGVTGHETFTGTITVNPDCTGTVTGNAYDESGVLAREVTWDVILVNHAREMDAIFSQLLAEPGDIPVPVTITGDSKKVGEAER